MTGYTGFSSLPAEQSGHYLALHAASDIEGATLTAELVGGVHGPVTLDEDGIVIFRVTSNAQRVRFTASKDGYTTGVKTLELTGLTLEA